MKQLQNLRWSPAWVSHLGCIKGCLDYLGLDITGGWLYGGTGHAFVLNMGQQVCPSGPTAWVTMRMFELGRNLGYVLEGVFGTAAQGDLSDLQRQAWDHARQAIDRGLPCYGWELDIPEFYVVHGYDASGYFFSGPGCDDGKGPKPWQELGATDIGVIEMYSVEPGPAADAATAVRQALTFALEHAQSPDKWIFPGYRAGLDGYDLWIEALQHGEPNQMGMSYNAWVWAECRRHAVAFLQQAQARLDVVPPALFDQAIDHYQAVARLLGTVSASYPFEAHHSTAPLPVNDKRRRAVENLKAAREAEAAGLDALQRILNALQV